MYRISGVVCLAKSTCWRRFTTTLSTCFFLAIYLTAAFAMGQVKGKNELSVTLGHSISKRTMPGRVFVFLSKTARTPAYGPDWYSDSPVFSMEVKGLVAGETVSFTRSAKYYPSNLDELKPGIYFAQAILDQSLDSPKPIEGPGNLFSKSQTVTIGGNKSTNYNFVLNHEVGPPQLTDTEFLKFLSLESNLLEQFFHRKVIERAAIILPDSYHKSPSRRYPLKIEITGFGATLEHVQKRFQNSKSERDFIRVVLTGQCRWGHHVYANSATNGPRGDMLVKELIPLIDNRFRTISKPEARFLTGHSSGGWSALWLLLNYSDKFAGAWSTAPDSVDFRCFPQVDIYQPNANMFTDSVGRDRPLARENNRETLWFRSFCRLEAVMGKGAPLRGFEAVFSPPDSSGLPKKCWDRQTGKFNLDVVNHWKNFDISRIIKEDADRLRPLLAGKINVYIGDQDTFYLNEATSLLKRRLADLEIPANIQLISGKDHHNLVSEQLEQKIHSEMLKTFQELKSD